MRECQMYFAFCSTKENAFGLPVEACVSGAARDLARALLVAAGVITL